ncbi:DUF642 containing protein kinase superfamily protein [Klebsormidium nitens]|uniref:DUF642 containing protein kinase superfamily protein n=1 Tax=Klebsormidium nitens TaxID=105231 RepID=A0A1Y1I8E6_KLENI|nr:DUF642 containing protein kinase superfamily protein [Klebsormidium nitens]|eukprot:GAQ86222.1 DUF642 containing protein kinase superfamily protein [Klebsormidium nitens]
MAVFTALLLLLALVCSSVAAPRSLLQIANPTFTNGDFALPGFSALNSGGYATFSSRDVIPGWVITAGTVDYVSARQWQAPPGASYSLDCSGNEAGSIQQNFVTTPGSSYTVSFYLAGTPTGSPIKTLQVSKAGATQNYTFDITNTTVEQMGYLPKVFDFVATASATTLVFTSLTQEGNGPVIGNVFVTEGTARPIAPAIAPIPGPAPALATPDSAGTIGPVIGGVLAGAALLLALAALSLFCLYRQKKRRSSLQSTLEEGGKDETLGKTTPQHPVSKPRQEHFTLKQLQKGTDSFNGTNIIGRGSFGIVYKGVLEDGSVIAVKRLESRPGRKDIEERSWKAEVEALGKVRHKNLVPLLGVCVDRGERLLVFEHFVRGSLDRRLHDPRDGEPVLSWADRINIARGVCRGLIYLHNDIRPPIVHRDIKAANVLLTDDEIANACIADFGLAHLVQDSGWKTSTMVKGTVPYMAPEYLHGGASFLTPKCDVYSFGMLFLELVSGRPVVSQIRSGVMERLSKIAVDMTREGKILELVDPKLGNDYDVNEARNYIHVALACLRTDPSARPNMESVGSQLALVQVVDSSFREEDLWDSEGSSPLVGSLSSSSNVLANNQSTVLVASRFVTPR